MTFGDLVRAYNLNASLFWAITLETWAIFVLASAFSISATLTRLTAGTLRTFSCCFLEKLRKWAFKWGKITSICSTQFTSSDGWLNPGSSGGATGGVGGRVGGGARPTQKFKTLSLKGKVVSTGPGLGLIMYIFTTLEFPTHNSDFHKINPAFIGFITKILE